MKKLLPLLIVTFFFACSSNKQEDDRRLVELFNEHMHIPCPYEYDDEENGYITLYFYNSLTRNYSEFPSHIFNDYQYVEIIVNDVKVEKFKYSTKQMTFPTGQITGLFIEAYVEKQVVDLYDVKIKKSCWMVNGELEIN